MGRVAGGVRQLAAGVAGVAEFVAVGERGDALWVRVGLAETWRQADAPAARSVDVVQGWNTVGWTGPDSGASDVASLLGAEVVIGYDAASQAFLRYAAEGPSFLNSLETVRHGDGLWAFLSAPGSATIPASGAPGANGDVIEEEPVPMELTSAAFGPNETIPSQYTCDGADLSPPLTLSGIPADAVSLALIHGRPRRARRDVGALDGVQHRAADADPTGAGVLGTQRRNSFGTTGYGGPCPPSGTHRYFFTVYALSAELELAEGATKAQVLAAMEGLVLAQAELIGSFAKFSLAASGRGSRGASRWRGSFVSPSISAAPDGDGPLCVSWLSGGGQKGTGCGQDPAGEGTGAGRRAHPGGAQVALGSVRGAAGQEGARPAPGAGGRGGGRGWRGRCRSGRGGRGRG